MEMRVNNNITIENAKIVFRNFTGKGGRFNAEGKRNFCVILDDEIGAQLAADGWNIRYLQPKDEGEQPTPYIQVTVNYDNVQPKIILVTSHGKTPLDEASVNILDFAEIENVDLIIRPYNWSVNGKDGVKAYVKTMYVTIVEDEFESKYYDVPDSARNAMREDD